MGAQPIEQTSCVSVDQSFSPQTPTEHISSRANQCDPDGRDAWRNHTLALTLK